MTWKLYIPNDKSDDGWVVDEAGDFVAVGLKPNRRENARLIAAAPDLLAALHEVLSLCDRDSDIGRVVIAAIAKAKGN